MNGETSPDPIAQFFEGLNFWTCCAVILAAIFIGLLLAAKYPIEAREPYVGTPNAPTTIAAPTATDWYHR